jgi:hypothetical protein
MMPAFSRRQLLRTLIGSTAALAGHNLIGPSRALALGGNARRLIVFYFPDGVPGPSASGEPSLWHADGSGTSYTMPDMLSELSAYRDQLTLFRGLSMGATDSGSHPGGAKKLLTGADGGAGESIDQFLARTVGADMPHRHVYLGAQSAQAGISGDRFISYVGAGTSTTPEDNPVAAFNRLFAGATPSPGGPDPRTLRQRSILDLVLADLNEVRAALSTNERARLDLHVESIREVEQRLEASELPVTGDCASPAVDLTDVDSARLYDPALFPTLVTAQTDVLVSAMACNLTRVGVLQASYHTSELIMSRFVDTEMYDPGYDMRSHQASHYGSTHNWSSREFSDYVAQRRWWVGQYKRLLDELASRPEEDGTMLDYSLVLLCTEVCDGNTHLHDDMPFVLAGRGAGRVNTGRLLSSGYTRHSNLLTALARAMGSDVATFGWDASGPLDGLLAS